MTELLASWRDTPTRAAIIDFVAAVSGDGPEAVPPEERVAVFDNDGTLWTEKPVPTYLLYIVGKWKQAVEADPSLAAEQPYRAVAAGDLSWIGAAIDKHYAGDDADLGSLVKAIVGVTLNQTVDWYAEEIAEFFATAVHPLLGTSMDLSVYAPMVELLAFLESHGFANYVVSGGERDFMRPMTTRNYGIPPERVVGSAFGLEYRDEAQGGDVVYGASLSFLDDGPEKPIRIWSRIGRRPILAVGNSNGDLPMLRFVQRHPRHLSLLINHDDDTGRGDLPYTKGAEQAMAGAADDGITVVSVKDDWSRVFPEAPEG